MTERDRLIKELTEWLAKETDTEKYRLLSRTIEFLKQSSSSSSLGTEDRENSKQWGEK